MIFGIIYYKAKNQTALIRRKQDYELTKIHTDNPSANASSRKFFYKRLQVDPENPQKKTLPPSPNFELFFRIFLVKVQRQFNIQSKILILEKVSQLSTFILEVSDELRSFSLFLCSVIVFIVLIRLDVLHHVFLQISFLAV